MPRCAAKNHASAGSDNSQEKLAWTPCLDDLEFIFSALLLLKVRCWRQVRLPIRSLGQVVVISNDGISHWDYSSIVTPAPLR